MQQHPTQADSQLRRPPQSGLELFGPEFAANPEAYYSWLRQLGPCAEVFIAPNVPVTLVTDYALALKILKDSTNFSRDSHRWRALANGEIPADSPALPMMRPRDNALFSDGAVHARLRAAVVHSLKDLPKLRLMRLTQGSAEALIDQFAARGGQADLMTQYCGPLPPLVLGGLFGCPEDIGERVMAGVNGIFTGQPGADTLLSDALTDLIKLKQEYPSNDITTRLLQYKSQYDPALNVAEAINQLVTMLSGGTLPLSAAIGSALALCLGDKRYREGGLPVEDAVLEAFRRFSPIANYAGHFPVRDIALDGLVFQAGDPILISFAAVNNHHAERSSDGQSSGAGGELGRAHLAFGAGPHACPAKDPATLIAVAATEILLSRLPDIQLACEYEQLPWRGDPWSRSLECLPVQFTHVEPGRIVTGGGVADPAASAPVPPVAAGRAPAARTESEVGEQAGWGRLFGRVAAWLRGE